MKQAILHLMITTALVSCLPSQSLAEDIDRELRALLYKQGIPSDITESRKFPDIDEPLPQLGMKLFYSKTLGGDFDVACATCHHPMLGGGDDLPLSIGVDSLAPDVLGPGRKYSEGDLPIPRNSPTTFNIGLWKKGLFWDSRVEELTPLLDGTRQFRTPDSPYGFPDPLAGSNLVAAQARFPVTSDDEMHGSIYFELQCGDDTRIVLTDRITKHSKWRQAFKEAFGDSKVTFTRISEALGAYQRSQVFVKSPWQDYLSGDNSALSREAKEGALLFYRDQEAGGGNCSSCHSGAILSDENFWSIAAPQIGRGKHDGITGQSDFGRYRESQIKDDLYTFRTPMLLNVEVTAPYTHAGAFRSLEEIIEHHLDPKTSLANFDGDSAKPAQIAFLRVNSTEMIQALKKSNKVISTFNEPLKWSKNKVNKLVAFLKSLTDPCVKSRTCLSPWIAQDPEHNPDGNLLTAKDSQGLSF